MRDEIDGRLWAEHGQGWSEFVAGLVRQVGKSFRKLNEIQFDAPWRHLPKQEH